VDLFAGPGGWDVAARELGIEVTGIEFDAAACATRRAAGLVTIEDDVRNYGPKMFEAEGLIASPPCQTFSRAGKGGGYRALSDVLQAVKMIEADRDHRPSGLDEKTALVLEPLRWALQAIDLDKPYRWIALEQVPTVEPVWEAVDEVLERVGYNVFHGKLHAEQFGTIVLCPLHETDLASIAEPPSCDPHALAVADLAGIEWNAWLEDAGNVNRRASYVANRHSAGVARIGHDIGKISTAALESVFNAALLVRVVLKSANDATWQQLVTPLLSRALSEARTLPGRGGSMSMREAISGFESMGFTAGSIESLPNRLWAALCDLAKSYTTSTISRATTPPKISQSSAAMPITDYITESVAGKVLCGACDDSGLPHRPDGRTGAVAGAYPLPVPPP
jgi:hypothetical protein